MSTAMFFKVMKLFPTWSRRKGGGGEGRESKQERERERERYGEREGGRER